MITAFIVVLGLFTLPLPRQQFSRSGFSACFGRREALRPSAGVTGKAMADTSPYTSSERIDCKFTPEDFAPDGGLTRKVWASAEWVEFDHDLSGQTVYPQAETRAAALWTAHYLYFGFRCKYSTLNVYEGEDPAKERWGLWNRDVAEVFINPEPERVTHYYEFEVAPNNQWIDLEIDKTKNPFNDAGWDSHFEHATRVDAMNHVWTCEMRIPVASMGVPEIRAGAEWRLNFFRADGPGDDSQRRFMSWSTVPEGKSFHVPTRFGLIRFVK
jgi:alpha-galactosidase